MLVKVWNHYLKILIFICHVYREISLTVANSLSCYFLKDKKKKGFKEQKDILATSPAVVSACKGQKSTKQKAECNKQRNIINNNKSINNQRNKNHQARCQLSCY